jgi:hypothetical protein
MPHAAIDGARGFRLRLALISALALAALPALVPATVRAAATVPDEPGAVLVDGPTYAAIVADVDGDGLPELVRVTDSGADGSRLAVEIWRQRPDQTWAATAPAVVLRRGRGVGEDVISTPSDRDNLTPLLADGSVRLLLWHQGGRAHVLAAVNSGNAAGDQAPCCLTIWEVTEPAAGGPPALTLLMDTHRGGDTAFAVDMDGDGTDELAVREPAGANSPSRFSILRWRAGRFTITSQPLNAGDAAQPYLLGNSDGLRGDEIGLIGSFGAGATGFGLTRVSLRAGEIHDETSELPSNGGVVPVAPDGAHPSLILFGDKDQPLTAFSWPADKEMTQVGRSPRPGRPVGIIGTGTNLRVMVRRDAPPALDLIGRDLSASSVESVRPSDAAKPFLDKTYAPYLGPWPGSLPGGNGAQVYAGQLIRPSAGGLPASAPMAVLPGMAPLGQLGRDGSWIALAQRMEPPPDAAEMERRGGTLLQSQEFGVTLVRTSEVLAPEAAAGVIQPTVEDAVVDARGGTKGQEAVLIGTPVFEATVAAPQGSLAMTVTGLSTELHVLVRSTDRRPSQQPEIAGPPFRIPIVSSLASGGNQAFDAALHVITPAGHGYTARWHVRLLRLPPKITAESPFISLTFAATIRGQTDPSATVTADGQTTHAGPDGRYQLTVPAGFIPRDVRIQAQDPIGNLTSVTANVVAPIDYRRLPWLPITGLLTAAAGAVLFLRAPRLARRRAATTQADDASFEEIDAD